MNRINYLEQALRFRMTSLYQSKAHYILILLHTKCKHLFCKNQYKVVCYFLGLLIAKLAHQSGIYTLINILNMQMGSGAPNLVTITIVIKTFTINKASILSR